MDSFENLLIAVLIAITYYSLYTYYYTRVNKDIYIYVNYSTC